MVAGVEVLSSACLLPFQPSGKTQFAASKSPMNGNNSLAEQCLDGDEDGLSGVGLQVCEVQGQRERYKH